MSVVKILQSPLTMIDGELFNRGIRFKVGLVDEGPEHEKNLVYSGLVQLARQTQETLTAGRNIDGPSKTMIITNAMARAFALGALCAYKGRLSFAQDEEKTEDGKGPENADGK